MSPRADGARTTSRSSTASNPGGGDHERDTDARAARLRVADTIGTLMEFWGFKRAMGRTWALLYTSPRAMPAAEIGEALQMSAGAVSMTLAELGKWGVVRRSWVPGDRRDFFEAETSVWKLVSRVVRERELALVREAKESFDAADRVLAGASQGAPAEERRRRAFERERIAKLRTLAEAGEKIVSALVSGEEVSATPLTLITEADAPGGWDAARRRKR